MKQIKRAASDEEKQQRVKDIIGTAERLLHENEYKDITMSKIAQETGLAKGTIFIYFQTKEELFLKLSEQAIASWSHDIQKEFQNINSSRKRLNINEFTDIIINSLGSNNLLKLLTMLDDTLEQNIKLETAIQFKTFLKNELSAIGKCMEEAFPMIQSKDGVVILQQLFVSVIGAYKVSNPSKIVKQAIQTQGLEMFDRNFQETLKDITCYYMVGYITKHS